MDYGLFTMPSHPPERSLFDGQQWDLQVLRWADELGFEAWIGEHRRVDDHHRHDREDAAEEHTCSTGIVSPKPRMSADITPNRAPIRP